jgi:hypothetical protein
MVTTTRELTYLEWVEYIRPGITDWLMTDDTIEL